MDCSRRRFLASGLGAGLLTLSGCRIVKIQKPADPGPVAPAPEPVLRLDRLDRPVIIQSIDLLRKGDLWIVRTRSKDGAFGMAVANAKSSFLIPVLQQLVIPFFLGKDARDLEALVDGVYLYQSNYKMSGLALWSPVAWVEFSILDLLGKISGQPVGEFFGGVIRREIPLYFASGNRDNTPEQEVEVLQKGIADVGVKAVKFKVGGRMRNDEDSIPGRSEKLIELSRKVLGDSIAIHADSNGSYGIKKGIEIGRRLETIRAHFYEEPCPFDWLEETRAVADALDIPVAGGEQESSLRRFRWMVENRAVQVVQPDLHYFGGFIRCTRVARMAAAAGVPITVHISGGNLGWAEMALFYSFTPNSGAYQEYKMDSDNLGGLFDPPIRVKNGVLPVPSGPGFGLAHAKEFLKDARLFHDRSGRG